MKTKTVKRHWCDFCNKAGLQAHAMAKHEAHCTLNPARKCRVCNLLADGLTEEGLEQKKPLADLIAMLPDPTAYLTSDGWEANDHAHGNLVNAVGNVLEELRAASGNCPACILAALRQKKIPVPMATDFSFKEEMSEIFSYFNESRDHY